LPFCCELEASGTPPLAKVILGEGVALDDPMPNDDDALAIEREHRLPCSARERACFSAHAQRALDEGALVCTVNEASISARVTTP